MSGKTWRFGNLRFAAGVMKLDHSDVGIDPPQHARKAIRSVAKFGASLQT
jgi:hypothetical protein